MSKEDLVEERLARIRKAVALDTPDRIPVVLEYGAFAARITRTPMPEFLLDPNKCVETMIRAYQLATEEAEADGIHHGICPPYALSYLWMSKVKVPGVDLPADASYQVIEQETMTREDYDSILERGWPDFFNDFMNQRIFETAPSGSSQPRIPEVDMKKAWADSGIPVLCGGVGAPPFELLSGGRSLTGFFMDLLDIPDKVEAVMDEMMPHMVTQACMRAKAMGFPAIWVGGWRGNPVMISPEMWDRFFWRYFRQLVSDVVEQGLIPILHLDASWTRELPRFKELPRAKVIMALDGYTDIFKAKEILGDHLCIMGDVPATMLAFDDPDTVYQYCSKLIQELGNNGFILQSGCDIPENAKLENVRAMVAAAHR